MHARMSRRSETWGSVSPIPVTTGVRWREFYGQGIPQGMWGYPNVFGYQQILDDLVKFRFCNHSLGIPFTRYTQRTGL